MVWGLWMIRKDIFIVGLLLVYAHFVNAMNLSIVKYNPTDEQCLRIARYIALREAQADKIVQQHTHQKTHDFLMLQHSAVQKVQKYLQTIDEDMNKAITFLRSIPAIKMGDFFSEITRMPDNVFNVARLLSQSNMIVFASYNKDIFTVLCKNHLPKEYEDRGGFFNPSNQKGVHKIELDEKREKISRDEMIEKLREMDFAKALSVFRFITQDGISLLSRRDNLIVDSIKSRRTVFVPGMRYYFSPEDLAHMTIDLENLLKTIVMQSNQAIDDENIDKRFQIKEEHVDFLEPRKTFIEGNKLFSNAQIRADITPPTISEKRKDKVLFWMPHLLVMILSDIVHSQTNGALQGTAGVLGCIFTSGIFGGYGFHLFDSHNSNVHKLADWFGVGNHKTEGRGGLFMRISIIHSALAIVTQRLLSLHMLPCTVLAGALSIFRAWRIVCDLTNMENVANKNPFTRANKEGLPFTLKDLVNGPKFSA